MLNVAVKKEIIEQMGRLDCEHQRRVLDFARALAVTEPKGIPGKSLLTLGEIIHTKKKKTKKKAIEDNCEKVDKSEW